MKIAVCTPHMGFIRAACAGSLNLLVARTMATTINYNGKDVQPEFGFFYEGTGPLEYKRTQLALRASAWGADYHLLLDWDHTFPSDAFLRLAAHDLPVVGANYVMRHGEALPVALIETDKRFRGTGIEPVAAIGLGLCLVKAEVFRLTPRPWFQNHMNDDGELVCGEDVHFCNQVRSAGIPIFLDSSLRVGHIAEVTKHLEEEGDEGHPALPASAAQ
jgi:hypothetical protein